MALVDDTVSARGGFTVTPSDTADLRVITRGLYVGTTGNLRVTLDNGDDVTFVTIAAGIIHPLYVKRVWSTNTTATNLVAVY